MYERGSMSRRLTSAIVTVGLCLWLSLAAYAQEKSFEMNVFGGESFYSIKKYQRKVGSLLYAAVTTRPNVAFAVSRLARFNINPGPQHHDAADRVLRYLKTFRGLALQYGGDDEFVVASDLSFADNTEDRKSSQGFAMKLFGGLIA